MPTPAKKSKTYGGDIKTIIEQLGYGPLTQDTFETMAKFMIELSMAKDARNSDPDLLANYHKHILAFTEFIENIDPNKCKK